MKKRIGCLVIFTLFAVLVKAQKDIDVFQEKHSAAELKKDIEAVKTTLESKDPNLYWYISKKQLNKKLDSLESAITVPMSNSAFRYKLACVLAAIGDGHMSLKFDADKLYPADRTKFDGSEVFPIQKFKYKAINDKLFIVENLSEDNSIAPGTEVLAIDGQPASQIIKGLLASIASDGYNQTFKYFYLNTEFADKYMEAFGFGDNVTFTLKVGEAIKTISLKKSNGVQKANVMDAANQQKSFLARYAYIKVSTFNYGMSDFNSSIFSAIKRSKINRLVLDLRNNNGGSQQHMIDLFSYLIDTPTFFAEKFKSPFPESAYGSETPVIPADAHFKGKLYVLINGGTFSAASLIAANLRADKNVTFIGSETGGAGDKCTGGTFADLTLPHCGLLLHYALNALVVPKSVSAKGRGVMPDVAINYQIIDFVQKKDLEFEWVKENVDKW
jgi:C-terminal processing protease CtpA/Prc